jgi:diguanylate cyclase (GGDEF)-like protein/putative nucleotidyltransferase with HDIG domain/PAS domain S-box-containing protein
MKVSTATRLSISLVALTLSVLLAAQSIGMMPDSADAVLKGRAHLCESLALSCSMAAQRGNFEEIHAIAQAIMSRNPDVLSLGLRRDDGRLLVDTGSHAGLWKLKPQDRSSDGFVQVPIFQGEKQWGTLELCFHPIRGHGIWAFLGQPVLRLLLFTAGLAYVAYLLYLRKTLRYLDPSSVIPERVKAMLDTLAEGVLVLDRRERVVLANDAFGALVGRPASQLAGLAAATLPWSKAKESKDPFIFPWAQTLRTGVGQRGMQISLNSATGGAERRLVLSCAPIHADKGATRGVLLTFDDVTEIEATNAQLRETLDMLGRSRDEIERQNKELQALATTDPLTGCRNRRSFHAEFQSRWGAAKRYNSSLACVMVDVDYFKKINDRYGHSTGDQVLQHVAAILRSLARESDMVCRYGGEEFCLLLPDADIIAASQAAERFRFTIETKSCGGVSVTASVGVSTLDLGAESPQALLDQADKCLYAAKRRGRNRVVRWDEVRDTPDTDGPQPVAAPAATPVSHHSSTPISFHAVTALMSALAHRDQGTADHSRRVADLCAASAVGLMSVNDRFLLEVGALLHDIGKLGVPDAVLLKPGELTQQEWAVMRSHDRMGVEIISAAFGSTALTEIVRTHHAQFTSEAFDPTLPKGRDIPLGARILALADAYDAMVSNRPYRGGREREQAFEELRRCAGGQFDPDLVEPFIAAVLARDRAAHARLNASPGGIPQTEAAATESVRDEIALRLRLEVERLAWAAEARDLGCLAEVARQVAATAAVDGLDDFADRVRELERMASDRGADVDYDALTRAVNQLLDECRSTGSVSPIERQGPVVAGGKTESP